MTTKYNKLQIEYEKAKFTFERTKIMETNSDVILKNSIKSLINKLSQTKVNLAKNVRNSTNFKSVLKESENNDENITQNWKCNKKSYIGEGKRNKRSSSNISGAINYNNIRKIRENYNY